MIFWTQAATSGFFRGSPRSNRSAQTRHAMRAVFVSTGAAEGPSPRARASTDEPYGPIPGMVGSPAFKAPAAATSRRARWEPNPRSCTKERTCSRSASARSLGAGYWARRASHTRDTATAAVCWSRISATASSYFEFELRQGSARRLVAAQSLMALAMQAGFGTGVLAVFVPPMLRLRTGSGFAGDMRADTDVACTR